MTLSREQRAAEIQEAIRGVLLRDWDPIGVSENPQLRDEYDSCIAPVYRILTGSRSEEDLVQFLGGDVFGVPSPPPEKLRAVAQKLLALDVRLSPAHT